MLSKFHYERSPFGKLFFVALFAFALADCAPAQQPLVNFSYLQHLTEAIFLDGDSVDIVHVYANFPSYQWVEAADAGVEGTACVDDAARAAIVYLRHFELTGDPQSARHAKALLRFVLAMQAKDGEFYNFLHRDHTINTTGRTSVKSFGWWAARAMWAIGTGFRVLAKDDSLFAGRLQQAFLRGYPHVEKLLERYGTVDTVSGYAVPRWLPYDSGADVTAELLLGLVEYASQTHDPAVLRSIHKLADGIMLMQDGSAGEFPFGLHRSWETQWHMWGNAQTQVLAEAGKRFGDSAMIASGKREADGFYSRLLIDGFIKECDIAKPNSAVRYEQIAYAVRPMALGLLRLYEATGNRDYAVMAGLAGSWLFGNNVLHQMMYDPSTGRCYDGIRDSVSLNKNAGAESTIEALSTVVELDHATEARRFLFFKKVSTIHTERRVAALFRDDEGNEVTVDLEMPRGSLFVLEGAASRKFQEEKQ
ncbi:MAG: hypothetical protein WB699_05025 [Bacteroidota bacterium]